MSGYSKKRRRSPSKMRSAKVTPQEKAQQDRFRESELERKRTTKRAAKMYQYKLALNDLNEGDLRILAGEYGFDPRDMDRDGIAVALIMRGWKP